MRQTGGLAVGEISDQVEPLLLGDRDGLRRRHDAELLAGVVDYADFADANPFVDPHAIVAAGTSVKSYNSLLRNGAGAHPARNTPATFPVLVGPHRHSLKPQALRLACTQNRRSQTLRHDIRDGHCPLRLDLFARLS